MSLTTRFAAVAGMAIYVVASGCLTPHAGLSKREQTNQVVLAKYSAVFQPGAKRVEVEQYLLATKTPFRQLCCVGNETSAFADLVQVGKDHSGWPFCDGAIINVAFVFAGKGPLHHADAAADVLQTITLFEKMESCL